MAVLLAACASRKPPQVVERSLTGSTKAVHVVAPGETLYSIAMRYERDYHELAALNQLDSQFTIKPGQRLRLSGKALPPSRKNPVKSPTKPVVKAPAPGRESDSRRTPVVKSPAPVPAVASDSRAISSLTDSLVWDWPVRGPVIGNFGSNGVTGKGLDIAGKRGDSVRAAASGVVVYAGSGLVGYGRLLIIRHDDNYISAYAHNDRFLVGEGERVKLGQAIAEMGASGADREKLHFEIRERGKPVDPLRFLPARE
jgi:lipoprotein NlpD